MWRSAHVRHSGLNLAGAVAPMLVGVLCLGILARALSTTDFSLLLLLLALVGYAGVLDLGVSRAVVVLVSEQAGNADACRNVLRTAFLCGSGLGLLVALLVVAAATPLVDGLLGLEGMSADGAVSGFRIAALTIPILIGSLAVQGYLDGRQQFLEANVQRFLSGSLPMVGASAWMVLDRSLQGAMTGFLVGRAIALAIMLARARILRDLVAGRFSKDLMAELLGYGGWVTVSGVVSPLMGYLDRFILAASRGADVVAYYAAPAEAVFRMLVVPTAITRSLFPKLSSQSDTRLVSGYLSETNRLIALSCLPLAAVVLVAAGPILTLWLGADLAGGASGAFRILALGFIPAAFAQVPFTRLLAARRPDLVAKLHMAELLPFLALSYYLGLNFGPAGSAAAWSIRNLADYLILNLLAARYAPR
jgi:O-antigen/teichoic acid export membrane protein